MVWYTYIGIEEEGFPGARLIKLQESDLLALPPGVPVFLRQEDAAAFCDHTLFNPTQPQDLSRVYLTRGV